MLIGVEFNEQYGAMVASYYNQYNKVDYVIKKLSPSDMYTWTKSREETEHIGWDGSYLKRRENRRINRFRLQELMREKFDENDWAKIKSTHRPVLFFLDIETEVGDNNEFPEPEEAKYPVNLISLVHENQVIVLTTLSDMTDSDKTKIMSEVNKYVQSGKIEFELKYFYFENEKRLLESFFHKILPKIPFITGWNVIEFDWLTLVNRADRNKVGVTFNLPSKILNGQFKIPTHLGIIDYIEAFKKFKPLKAVENHQLSYIASRTLNIKKLENPYSSFKEFQQDHLTFVKYNIIDSILVRLIDQKHALLESSFEIACISNVGLNKIFSPVFMTEMFMCDLFLDDNKHLWIKNTSPDSQEKYIGAYVKEPKPGYYENISCFDFSSMYPNIQMQFNISPDAFLGRVEDVKLNELKPGSYTVTKNDTVFTLTFDSVAKRILNRLYNERNAARKEIKKLKSLLKENEA